MIATRFALYVALTGLFGWPAFALYGLRGGATAGVPASRWWIAGTAALAAILSLWSFNLMAASMAGVPPLPVDRDAVAGLLATPSIGTAWLVRMVVLGLAAFAALIGATLPRLIIVTCAAAVALTTLAWTGHGAMDDGMAGWIHLGADIIHLIAAGIWVGALLGLIVLTARRAADPDHLQMTYQALHCFGRVGAITVVTIIATGLINAWILFGPRNLLLLGNNLYGQLLIAKIALLAIMLCLASLNRFRLTPAFQTAIALNDYRRALEALRASLAVESPCALSILGVVAWLGTLAPPMSQM